MLDTIKTWFKPPQFENEAKTRRIAQLHALLWIMLGMTIIYIIFISLVTQTLFSYTTLTAYAFTMASGLAIWVLRQGHIRLASSLIIIALWLGVTVEAWLAGGWHNTTTLGYINVILVATLLLSDVAIIIFTALTITAVGVFAYAQGAGILVPIPRSITRVSTELIAILITSVVFIYLIKHSLKRALHQAQQSNRQLLAFSTDLENQITERTEAAEAAQAAAEAAQQEITKQMWLTTGHARLSEAMRGEQTIPTLANNVISQLCHYLEIPGGNLFILKNDYLSLVGSYALTPQNGMSPFRLGEGLVGQAALQGEPSLWTDIPTNCLMITSGIGKMPLPYILVQPFLYEANVLGVIQLAHWCPFTEPQKTLMQSVANSIAIAFHTAQNRSRINELVVQIMEGA